MKSIDFRRVFVMTGLAALVIIYAVLWMRMISSPSERTGSDFISSYTGGRVADLWGAANVYNLEYQQHVQEEVVGFELIPSQVLIFIHPPYLVPFLALLMSGNYIVSLICYALVMVALYAIALAIVWRLLRLNGWASRETALVVAGMATFYPLFISLVNTQDTALMVLGGMLWLFGLLTGGDGLAGLGLALTSVRPHVTLVLAVPFLFRRQKVFAWFCAGGLGLGLVSLLAVGVGGLKAYAAILLTAAGGESYGLKEPFMVNLVGLLWRIVPGLGASTIHLIGWVGYGLALAGLCMLWRCSQEIGGKQVVAAAVLSVFAAPHLHYHDLTFLLVPLVGVLIGLVKGRFLSPRQAALVPLATSLALLFGSLVPVLQYNLPYLVMILIVLSVWAPAKLMLWRRNRDEILS